MPRRYSSWAIVALAGTLVGGTACRLDLDTPLTYKDVTCEPLDVPVCRDATEHSDFTWIHANVLAKNCNGTACHVDGGTNKDAARLKFDDKALAYNTLVDPGDGPIMSQIQTDLPLIAKGEPERSYMLFLMKAVPRSEFVPSDIPEPPKEAGYMPRGNGILCCQKLDAVERWVAAGANND
ncbi:MAG: hypothetical protein H0T79_03610 [Deltaproteobacteria bacterium]|nr:hypothetical protein [Deltaproteobacteria bacterium]